MALATVVMTAGNEWARSVRREIWFRLRARTMRWPLTRTDDRVRLIDNVEEIEPIACVGRWVRETACD